MGFAEDISAFFEKSSLQEKIELGGFFVGASSRQSNVEKNKVVDKKACNLSSFETPQSSRVKRWHSPYPYTVLILY